MSRAERKLDHIRHALSTGQSRKTGLDDITFIHQALPDRSWEDLSLHTQVGGLNFSSPFFINAMTGGGGDRTKLINGQLARIAKDMNIPMAVGSQMAALKDEEEKATYSVVRKENPTGLIFANIGSEATAEQAKEAVQMIEADALQIHLNVIQELTMPEGDRDFRGALERIEQIINELPVPVIIKETGFGLSRETVHKLKSLNVGAIDVGGFGGTNFAVIENERRNRQLAYFDHWGIPTAASVVEVKMEATNTPIIASGGIQNALDIVKCLSLGASAVGLAGFILKLVVEQGEDATSQAIEEIKEDIKMMMFALCASTVSDLQNCPILIKGELYHYLTQRGYDTSSLANRKKIKR
ncbi:MAG: type 2 isopentenyl-diphosphate Delta-isomerase [Paenisporosarcina sp.]